MLMRSCQVTPLQRRTVQRTSGLLVLTILTNLASPGAPNPLFDIFPGLARVLARQHATVGYAGLLSLIALLPIVLGVWIAASYLKQEPDEFVRMLVVRALLWGFTITMAGDAVLGVLTVLYAHPFPVSLLNADLFVAGTGIAFRVLRRSYR